MAALLAHRAMQVVTLECEPELARAAAAALRRNGVGNARVLEVSAAEGARGLPARRPSTPSCCRARSPQCRGAAAAAEDRRPAGGHRRRAEPIMRARLYTRAGRAAWSDVEIFDTVAPRLQGFAEPRASELLSRADPGPNAPQSVPSFVAAPPCRRRRGWSSRALCARLAYNGACSTLPEGPPCVR
jgi:hypothetical protein